MMGRETGCAVTQNQELSWPSRQDPPCEEHTEAHPLPPQGPRLPSEELVCPGSRVAPAARHPLTGAAAAPSCRHLGRMGVSVLLFLVACLLAPSDTAAPYSPYPSLPFHHP